MTNDERSPRIPERFQRMELLVGREGVARLAGARVMVFGLGGVGSYAVEALARAGVGRLALVDFDVVAPTNINRQLFALDSTIGQFKTEVARARILDINPDATVECFQVFAGPDTLDQLPPMAGAYVLDAIDTVSAKAHLLAAAHRAGAFTVSCMGAGNKVDPRGVLVDDISATRDCPLARAVRQQLRKAGVAKGILCVYSRERRNATVAVTPDAPHRKTRVQGSIAHMPGIFGLTAAGVIIGAITGCVSFGQRAFAGVSDVHDQGQSDGSDRFFGSI